MDRLFHDHLPFLITHLPPSQFISFFLEYTSFRPEVAQETWLAILSFIGSFTTKPDEPNPSGSLLRILAEEKRLPQTLVARDELSKWVEVTLDSSFSVGEVDDRLGQILSRTGALFYLPPQAIPLMISSGVLIDAQTIVSVRNRVQAVLQRETQQVLRDPATSLASIKVSLSLLKHLEAHVEFVTAVIPNVFLLAHFRPSSESSTLSLATQTWDNWVQGAPMDLTAHVAEQIRKLLKEAVQDTNILLR